MPGQPPSEKPKDDPAKAEIRQVSVAAAGNPHCFLRLPRGLEQRPPVADRDNVVGLPVDDQHRRADVGDPRATASKRSFSSQRTGTHG